MSTWPKKQTKLIVTELSPNFRKATKIVSVDIPEVKPNELLVQNYFLGINASDCNFTSGKYIPGVKPPLDCGFEAIGKVVHVGSNVKNVKVGDAVVVTSYNAFGDYIVVNSKQVIKIAAATPEALPIMVSGLTASIALEHAGRIKSGETVLVTAAAGATGQFAVQFAKLSGCHVIGTCSSDEKCDYLKSLGVDRAINYIKEDLFKVLRSEYPKGVDVVYESVGGETFNICVDNLAIKGRLIVIGFISGYKDGSGWTKEIVSKTPLPVKLLGKSTSIIGFFLNNYTSEWAIHLEKIQKLYFEGKLKIEVDKTKFYGLESVADAIDHLLTGKNIGKVYVSLVKQSNL